MRRVKKYFDCRQKVNLKHYTTTSMLNESLILLNSFTNSTCIMKYFEIYIQNYSQTLKWDIIKCNGLINIDNIRRDVYLLPGLVWSRMKVYSYNTY